MLKSINRIIKIFIASDLALNWGWGLLGPVFAIFIVQNITAGSATEAAKIAGFATLTYWMVKSSLQIPIGKYLDRNHGEKDDFWFMVIGMFITGLVPFGYLFASLPWHIYICQALHAIGMSLVVPSLSAIFTRHIDKGKEAFEWGTRSTVVGYAIGISGAIGGILVAFLGFKIIFIMVGIFTMVSTALLLLIHKEISPKDRLFPRFKFF